MISLITTSAWRTPTNRSTGRSRSIRVSIGRAGCPALDERSMRKSGKRNALKQIATAFEPLAAFLGDFPNASRCVFHPASLPFGLHAVMTANDGGKPPWGSSARKRAWRQAGFIWSRRCNPQIHHGIPFNIQERPGSAQKIAVHSALLATNELTEKGNGKGILSMAILVHQAAI